MALGRGNLVAYMPRAGDCAVIISNSGRSRDLLDVADIARNKGAAVLACRHSAQHGQHHILPGR